MTEDLSFRKAFEEKLNEKCSNAMEHHLATRDERSMDEASREHLSAKVASHAIPPLVLSRAA
jgi:hypothetical protein